MTIWSSANSIRSVFMNSILPNQWKHRGAADQLEEVYLARDRIQPSTHFLIDLRVRSCEPYRSRARAARQNPFHHLQWLLEGDCLFCVRQHERFLHMRVSSNCSTPA